MNRIISTIAVTLLFAMQSCNAQPADTPASQPSAIETQQSASRPSLTLTDPQMNAYAVKKFIYGE